MALTKIKLDSMITGTLPDANIPDNITITGAQTGITSVGTLTSFASTGIDDNADALAITIDSSEKVGIGIAPNRRLTVYSASTSDINIKNTSADFLIQQAGHNTFLVNSSTSGYLDLSTNNGNSSMRMLANGNVGIGETVPNAVLHITRAGNSNADALNEVDDRSAVKIQYRADGEGAMYIGSLGGGDGYIQGADDDGDVAYDISINPYGGNVGIGVSSPTELLHIKNPSNSWNEYAKIRIGTESSDLYACEIGFHRGTDSNDDRGFFIDGAGNGAQHLKVLSTGNVGIGQTAPDSPLMVENDQSRTSQTGTTFGLVHLDAGQATDDLTTITLAESSGKPLTIIGAKTDTGAGSSLFFGTSNNYNNGITQTGMTINPSGNVGIGIAAPATTLHVDATSSGEVMRLTYAEGTVGQILAYATSSGGLITIADSGSTADVVLDGRDNADSYFNSGGSTLFGKTSSSATVAGTTIGTTSAGITSSNSSLATNTYHVYRTGATSPGYKFYVNFGGQIYSTETSISALSDIRLKENIVDLETGLSEVMALKPRRFDWKEGDNKNVTGFIAQEVETVLPDLIGDFKHNEIDDCKSLKMGDMLPTLVKAIQELSDKLDTANAKIEALENA